MFLIYRIDEAFEDKSYLKFQPEDALYDVFYRFHPEELYYLGCFDSLNQYICNDDYMDCGDWVKGYTTYYNHSNKEKHLIVDLNYKHTNSTIISLIREHKLNKLK